MDVGRIIVRDNISLFTTVLLPANVISESVMPQPSGCQTAASLSGAGFCRVAEVVLAGDILCYQRC
jgi:hypothetical protein